MSTINRPEVRTLPPLVDGEWLDQPTFHERYEAMPDGTWAELVGGRVCMPSPLRDEHVATDDVVSYWLGHYRRFTPGTRSVSNVTTILGPSSEVQPDHQLRIINERVGSSRVVEGYIHGPPELVIEVARSSRWDDLGTKKNEYEKAGVREYVVVELSPDHVHWFVLRDGRYESLAPRADGLVCSEVFPGLWLDRQALFDEDLEALASTVDRGLATPEHAALVERLK